MFEAFLAAVLVAVTSLVGAAFFGNAGRLSGAQRFVVPMAVGVFLSLVLYELIPETLAAAPTWGGIAVAVGFIAFYVLANYLHTRFHHLAAEDCDRKSAAVLLLIGDSIHNVADGVVIGAAFMIDPAVGVATTIGLALHEIPQEILEFGVLVRAGYSRWRAAALNLLSAGGVVVGVVVFWLMSIHAEEFIWVVTGIAAGNLLFLAASDLLPRIHGNLERYGSIWNATFAIIIGFTLMTVIITYAHGLAGHEHDAHAEQERENHNTFLHDSHEDKEHDDEHEDTHVD